jgi:hypothetical protein
VSRSPLVFTPPVAHHNLLPSSCPHNSTPSHAPLVTLIFLFSVTFRATYAGMLRWRCHWLQLQCMHPSWTRLAKHSTLSECRSRSV